MSNSDSLLNSNISSPIRWSSDVSNKFSSNSTNAFIYIGSKSLNLVISDVKGNKMLLLHEFPLSDGQDFPNQLRSVFQKNEVLQTEFRDVYIAIESMNNTLIPEKIKHTGPQVFQIENGIVPKEFQLNSDSIDEIGIASFWKTSRSKVDSIMQLFPKCFLYSTNASWIKEGLAFSKKRKSPLATIWLFDHHMHLCIFNNSEFIFSNTFSIESTEDILYYVLFTLDQFSISSDEISLVYGGSCPFEIDEIQLKQYVKVDSISTVAYSVAKPAPNEKILQKHLLLTQFMLCV